MFREDVVERFAALFIVSLISISIAGCRTAGTPSAKLASKPVGLTGQLQLIDATPVAGVELQVQCGWFKGTARTGSDGTFSLKEVPEGECRVLNERARVDQVVRVGANLLRGTSATVVTVAPVKRHTLASGVESDETLWIWHKPDTKSVRSAARAWMPLPYRPAPRGGEIKKVPLLDALRLVSLDTSAKRTLVYLLPCNQKTDLVPADLRQLPTVPGLKVAVVATPICLKSKLPANVLRGSGEVLWALSARPGDLVLLDSDGMVLGRSPDRDPVAFLTRSWALFAAARQVSVLTAHSVRIAEAARLIAQAANQVRARRYAAAHGLVDRALRLDPELAEAHRQRAILKARLGDVSGAMREVTWWRTSFGEESADDLLDEIQQVTARR